MDTWDENVVIICQNCIFVHITDNIFPVTGFPLETRGPTPPKVEVLEPRPCWA